MGIELLKTFCQELQKNVQPEKNFDFQMKLCALLIICGLIKQLPQCVLYVYFKVLQGAITRAIVACNICMQTANNCISLSSNWWKIMCMQYLHYFMIAPLHGYNY